MLHLPTFALLALFAVAAAAAAKPTPANRLDALDFDNGALLTRHSGSYAGPGGTLAEASVSDWSTWRLTDGSPQGWCSPKGETQAASFEWQLDTTWRLDTLNIDNTGVEEDSYPGISAKAITLQVADAKGPWRMVGKFTSPQGKKASFALPKDVTAARVRIDVAGNYGCPDYTEIGELDLLGQRTQPAPNLNLSGIYASTYGAMRIVQEGDLVWGCYDFGSVDAQIWGAVTGSVAQVAWSEVGDDSVSEGTATFAVVPASGESKPALWGVWFDKSGQLAGTWAGPSGAEPPKCQPRKKGMIWRQLQQRGHVALYGIRFDSDSDVPRPESNATLEDLALALRDAPTARVAIEGHTDSTNTAQHNLDLSQRRAKAVVTWLTQHGIAAERLTAKGVGMGKPVADNATVQGRALNRRVEVVLSK